MVLVTFNVELIVLLQRSGVVIVLVTLSFVEIPPGSGVVDSKPLHQPMAIRR
jgi:hypothetical protein